jgi:diguanylate cyclase (GGDEF)-like protein
MELWIKRRVRSTLVPGGVIVCATMILLSSRWVSLPGMAVNFFFHATFLAAALLAWRFHSRRIFWSALMLWVAHFSIDSFSGGRAIPLGPARTAFEAMCFFIPLNLAVLTFFPDRDVERPILAGFLLLVLLEAIFVLIFARPEQPSLSFLDYPLLSRYHPRLPQLAIVLFTLAASLTLVEVIRFEKAIDHGLLWSLVAAAMGLEAVGSRTEGTVYFGVAGLVLAISIVENSYALAYQDELTGLSSRRAFTEALERLRPPYSFAMVDIDHFKSINDSYGHDIGDQVLRLVASRLARVTGGGEAFRLGGEEFTILFRARSAEQVLDHLELLRLDIENSSFQLRRGEERRKSRRAPDRRMRRKKPRSPRSSGRLSVTVSIGVAESHLALSAGEIVERADQALYRAKQGGRNRIELSAEDKKAKREISPKGQAQS